MRGQRPSDCQQPWGLSFPMRHATQLSNTRTCHTPQAGSIQGSWFPSMENPTRRMEHSAENLERLAELESATSSMARKYSDQLSYRRIETWSERWVLPPLDPTWQIGVLLMYHVRIEIGASYPCCPGLIQLGRLADGCCPNDALKLKRSQVDSNHLFLRFHIS